VGSRDVRLLLDTQCWLWMVADPARMSARARAMVEPPDHELLLSAASSWEIAIKHGIGKLELPGDPEDVIPTWITRSSVTPLPVHHHHALRVAGLPPHHGDPFDRLLIAQAQIEGVPILSSDAALAHYDVEVLAC
jgi:PIN domain nuclease of toxin-antitoxin system